MNRLAQFAALAFFMLHGGAFAEPPVATADPLEATKAVYKLWEGNRRDIETGARRQWTFPEMSARVRALEARGNPRPNEVGCTSFDYFIGAQDGDIASTSVRYVRRPQQGRAIVEARFSDSGKPQVNRFIWISEGNPANWVIDEVHYLKRSKGEERLSGIIERCIAKMRR